MNTLLLYGMLPLYARLIKDVSEANIWLWPSIMVFILLASVTVLNMLIGVLVEVVRTVAATEKEGMTVTHVTHQLREVMDAFNNGQGGATTGARMTRISMTKRSRAGSGPHIEPGRLSRADFEVFLLRRDVAMIVQDIGVDVVGLIDMADMIYEDKDKEGHGLSFVDFIDVVLNMRGTNPSTVKDVKQQIRVMKNALHDTTYKLKRSLMEDLDAFRMEVVEHLIEIRKQQAGSDAGSDTEGAPMAPWRSRLSTMGDDDIFRLPSAADAVAAALAAEDHGEQVVGIAGALNQPDPAEQGYDSD
jgi:hypothetical protein